MYLEDVFSIDIPNYFDGHDVVSWSFRQFVEKVCILKKVAGFKMKMAGKAELETMPYSATEGFPARRK